MIDRRCLLSAAAYSRALSALGIPQRATSAYVRDKSIPQGVLDRIGYDEHGKLKFNPQNALFPDGPGRTGRS